MAKKALFDSNPLDDHPMFSKPGPQKAEPDTPSENPKPAAKKKLEPVPKKTAPATDDQQLIKKTYYLTNDIHKNLKLYALQHDMNVSDVVQQIFSEFLRKKGVDA